MEPVVRPGIGWVGGTEKTGGLQWLQQMLTACFSFWHYTSKSIKMTYSQFFLLLETISVSKLAAWAEISGFLSLLCTQRNCDADWICVYVNVRGGCEEEAVFGPRLKCRTRVPAPGKETSRAETRGTCLPSGKRDTAKITLALREQRKVSTISRMYVHRRDKKAKR